MELVLFEPSRPHKPALRIPLDKVRLPLREFGLVGACTNSNCLCYNSFTGQGQLLWVGVCLQHSIGRGFAWCPWCPLTSEFGSMGLKQATQANRLNLRKASKDAGFR